LALDGAVLADFLFNTRTGAIWSARLLLPTVAAMLLGPLIAAALRGEHRQASSRRTKSGRSRRAGRSTSAWRWGWRTC
jgi:hypothetical protein